MCEGRCCECEKAVSVALSVPVAVNRGDRGGVSARVGVGWGGVGRGSPREPDPGCAPGAPLLCRSGQSAGVGGGKGQVRGPGRGRLGLPLRPARVRAWGAPSWSAQPGWGLVGEVRGGGDELTVAGDVVVPGRVAGGPRGAAELQEKCQVVEGAQRHRERGSHGARSGQGRRRLTSGLRIPQTLRPPCPARCGLAARLRPLPLAR